MNIVDIVTLFVLALLVIFVLISLNKINETLNLKINLVQGEFTKHLISSEGTVNLVTKKVPILFNISENLSPIPVINSLICFTKPPKIATTPSLKMIK